MNLLITAFILLLSVATSDAEVDCSDVPGTMTCQFTTQVPTLDADLSDWADVNGITTRLFSHGESVEYLYGKATFKCMYDATQVYFSMVIPGDYRFNATSNKKCASISTMMRIGTMATYDDMGGCPEAKDACPSDLSVCDDYRVDVGAHWELATTQRNVMYDFNITGGTGNDLTANKDDEYSVSAECRKDDNDANAGNEWAGAWTHSNPVAGGEGEYTFELSRLLVTSSLTTDAQMEAGGTYDFGIAYWDPYQDEEKGWTDDGHYLTGCGDSWIDLVLEMPPTKAPVRRTRPPVPPPSAPVFPTKAPVRRTRPPVPPPSAPVFPTKAPVRRTRPPSTKAPVSPTKAPVSPTKAPVSPTKAPVSPTKAPVSPTKAPVSPTKAPVSPTKVPTPKV